MGLTIHWTFESAVGNPDAARDVIRRLREEALDLPSQEVGPLLELTGDDCQFENCDRDTPHRWLRIQAGRHLEQTFESGTYLFNIPAEHVIAFETQPGEGTEPANFGLARYPASIEVDDPDRRGWKRRLPTGLAGWSWSTFCKTQYASDPRCGGVENFLRCHLLVISLLDRAQALGLSIEVSDEGGFWDGRDVRALAEQVGRWDEGLAAFVGQMKDSLGVSFEAPITGFPDFEHLEAKGRAGE